MQHAGVQLAPAQDKGGAKCEFKLRSSSLAECMSLLAERKAAPGATEGVVGGSSPTSTCFGAGESGVRPTCSYSILPILTIQDTLSIFFHIRTHSKFLAMEEKYVNNNSLYCISRLNLGFSLLFSF